VAKTATKKAPARKGAASKSVSAKAAGASGAAAKRPTKATASKSAAKAAPKVAKKSAGTTASPILTLRHIAEQLSEAHELPKRQANEVLTQVIEMIAKSLKKDDKIRLSGLGILQVRKRAARTGRILRPASQSRSKPLRRSLSDLPRNSRKRSDRQP
jgi:DNA-binding protein HU-beta